MNYLYWYDNKIIIPGPNGTYDKKYLIDTKKKEVNYLPEEIVNDGRKSNEISPTGRFIPMQINKDGISKSVIYDFETNAISGTIKTRKGGRQKIYWNDYNTFSFLSPIDKNKKLILRTQSVGTNNHSDLLVYSWEDRKSQPLFIMPSNTMWDSRKTSLSHNYGRGKIFFDHKIIFTAHNPTKLVYKDITTGEWETLAQPNNIWDYETYNISYENFGNFVWVNNEKIIFTNSKDLLKQGTFVFDTSTKQAKKLLDFVADDCWKIPLTEYTVFIANNVIYSYNSTTEEMQEIGKSKRSTLMRGDDQISLIGEDYSIK